MIDRSWTFEGPDPPELGLPSDLRERDPMGACDMGWVGPLRPLVRRFCPPGGTVLDPFCGFGTTLLAAALEGRRGFGIDVDRARAALARERLHRLGLPGEVETHLPGDTWPPIDLVLTNLPYFGARPAAPLAGQLYAAPSFEAWRRGLRDAFHALRPSLRPGAYVIASIGDTRVGGHGLPQVAEAHLILAALFEPCEARLWVYPPREPSRKGDPSHHPRADEGDPSRTDRSHETVLVFRHQRRSIDVRATRATLTALRADGFDVAVHGSFPEHALGPSDVDLTTPPGDLDLLLPHDSAHWSRLLRWLEDRDFRLTLWGERVNADVTLERLARHHVLRAERIDAQGRRVAIDLMVRDQGPPA